MNQCGRILGIIGLTCWLPAVHASARAVDIQKSLSTLTADPRALTAPGASNLSACNVPLESSADIDVRLEWARAVKSCLETAQSALQTDLMLADPKARPAALITQNATNSILANVTDYEARLMGEKDFIGIKWGIGVGISHGFDDIVDEAQIVDGVVRVKKDHTDQPRVILEFHSYRWCHSKRTDDRPIETGCGPYAAVTSRDDQAVSGVAAGWMYGWKTGRGDDSQGFSVGLGVILDADGKELGHGFKEGEAPPPGATEVFLKEKSVASAVLFFTRTF